MREGEKGRDGGVEGLERGMDGTRASGDLLGFGRIQKDYRQAHPWPPASHTLLNILKEESHKIPTGENRGRWIKNL